jgi:hypothetical protein
MTAGRDRLMPGRPRGARPPDRPYTLVNGARLGLVDSVDCAAILATRRGARPRRWARRCGWQDRRLSPATATSHTPNRILRPAPKKAVGSQIGIRGCPAANHDCTARERQAEMVRRHRCSSAARGPQSPALVRAHPVVKSKGPPQRPSAPRVIRPLWRRRVQGAARRRDRTGPAHFSAPDSA